MNYEIEKITDKTRALVNKFFIENWFSTDMSIRGEIIDGTKLDGFLIMENQEIIGLATILSQNLTIKILEKGIVPIWCASSTNIGSQAVASRSNYIPLWVESFGDIYDKNYVYKELLKEIE